jgi:AraC-like DNA-binding protein
MEIVRTGDVEFAGQMPGPAGVIHVRTQVVARLRGALEQSRLKLEGYPAMSRSARRAAMLRKIDAYIGDHLADPALTPATIAAAHFISKRYLFALFSEQGTTVAAHIRALRLERCREDLADPSLADQAVGLIGTRWGFSSAAHFSRVFRYAHGIPPGEYRLLAGQETGGEPVELIYQTGLVS